MVAWPPTTLAWPFRDFFQNFPKLLETSKNVVWQSADGHVTTTTVAWPFSNFFQNSPKSLETSKKRCSTVGRRSRDLRPLSRDRSATFFKKKFNCLKRRKNVVWQSADGRVTSDHGRVTSDYCRVTVQWLFFKKFSNCLKHPKTLFDSRPTVAWPQPLSRDRSATFFKNSSNCLIPRKTVVWQSADGRVSTDLVWTSKKCELSRDGPAILFPWYFFVWHHILPCRCISRSFSFFPPKSLFTYLLLQEWSNSGNFDIISKLGIGRREFLILAGKFQLVDSLWGKQFPHYKHSDVSSTVESREKLSSYNTRENCRVNTYRKAILILL